MDKDEYLASGIAAHNESAFNQLLDEYGGLVKAIVKSRLSVSLDMQEEAMQDIFIAIWQNIGRFDAGKSSLKSWICAISRYKCIDYLRRSKRLPAFCEIDENTGDFSADPQLQFEVDSILDCLPSADRELFYRRYILCEPVGAIAKEKNIGTGLLYNRFSRAKRRLRKQLEGKGNL